MITTDNKLSFEAGKTKQKRKETGQSYYNRSFFLQKPAVEFPLCVGHFAGELFGVHVELVSLDVVHELDRRAQVDQAVAGLAHEPRGVQKCLDVVAVGHQPRDVAAQDHPDEQRQEVVCARDARGVVRGAAALARGCGAAVTLCLAQTQRPEYHRSALHLPHQIITKIDKGSLQTLS
jgi:hypothetical protein